MIAMLLGYYPVTLESVQCTWKVLKIQVFEIYFFNSSSHLCFLGGFNRLIQYLKHLLNQD
jgi:hypothetical protein